MVHFFTKKLYSFSFATGGAGFCISNGLMLRVELYIKNLNNISDQIGLPDDCTIGFIVGMIIYA